MKKTFKATHHTLILDCKNFESLKIVHIGDLHNECYGENNERLSEQIIKENPDLVLVTGDVFDRISVNDKPFTALLKSLNRKFPIYMCLGNHELTIRENHPERFEAFVTFISRYNVTVLENDFAVFEKNGTRVYLYGINSTDGPVNPDERLIGERLFALPAGGVKIVLAHNPLWFDVISKFEVDLVLAGHIHGGLLRFPNGRGLLSPGFKLFPKYDGGLFQQSGTLMYITRGFGNSIYNLRFNNRPELAVLSLKKGKDVQMNTVHESRLATILKCILTFILIPVSLWCLMPVAKGIIHIGVVGPAFFSAIVLICLWYWQVIKKKLGKFAGFLKYLFIIGLTSFMIFTCFATYQIVTAAEKTPRNNATVIVLGAKVNKSGPSLMLSLRLNAALEYLKNNPDSKCIVTGGKGPDEHAPEGEVMAEYLIRNGVSSDRVLIESKATSTDENIKYSDEIIAANGLPQDVVIATDGFHQYRAGRIAEKYNLSSSSVSSDTPFWLLGSSWAREVMAIGKYYVFGY